jgi:hypothetical protein
MKGWLKVCLGLISHKKYRKRMAYINADDGLSYGV